MKASLRRSAVSKKKAEVVAIHGTFAPADVREGERIACLLRHSRHESQVPYSVFRMSPFGVELKAREDDTLRRNESVELSLDVGGHKARYRGVVVAVDVVEGKNKLVGVRLDTTPKTQRANKDIDQRKEVRWACHHLFFPTGVAKNTARFNDQVHFRVLDISASGMRVATSMRNKYLTHGLPLQVRLFCPSIGEVKMKVEVVSSRIDESRVGSEHVLGVRFVKPSRQTLHALGQYVLQFGGDQNHRPSPKTLEDNGFFVHSIAQALEFDVVRSDAEYQEVLSLRAMAFDGLGGCKKTPEEMADVYDTRSRIVVCKHRQRIVGTVRICFHGPDDKFEEETYVSLPKAFPPRELVVEASRAAVHPDFRGSDLFVNLMRYTVLLTLQSGRRFCLQSTFKHLVPLYERMGFVRLDVMVPHPYFPEASVYMLLGDGQRLLEGRVRNPLLYAALVPSIRDLLEVNKNIRLGWVTRQRLRALELLSPVYRLLERYHMEGRLRDRRRRREQKLSQR